MGRLEQVPLGLRHYFASGVYVREMVIPAGVLAVGKIHRHEHIFVLLSGTLTIITEEGSETLTGPVTRVAPAGTKRCAIAQTDCILQNIHAVGEERDLEKIEALFIAPDFAALEDQARAQLEAH